MKSIEGTPWRLGGQLLLELGEVGYLPVLGELSVGDPIELKSSEIDAIAGRLDLTEVIFTWVPLTRFMTATRSPSPMICSMVQVKSGKLDFRPSR
ncbi:hypothetical protein NKJ81_00035 [Mesorhizobium sp. M0018]